jgi:carbohydrate diacid regulator
MVIIKHLPDTEGSLEERQAVWGQKLLDTIKAIYPASPLCLGIGSFAVSSDDLHQSYIEALSAVQQSLSGKMLLSIYDFDVMAFYLSQKIAAHPCLALTALCEKISDNIGSKYDIKNTISILLENNLNLTNTAKALYIHRNTLLFRLERLKKVTGLDPCHSINHAMLCKILLLRA